MVNSCESITVYLPASVCDATDQPYMHHFTDRRNFAKVDYAIHLIIHCSYNLCLALINRAGGLYGRILTEVVSTDRTQ